MEGVENAMFDSHLFPKGKRYDLSRRKKAAPKEQIEPASSKTQVESEKKEAALPEVEVDYSSFDINKAKRRVIDSKYVGKLKQRVFKTGVETWDALVGLPIGLSIFRGRAGTGKSKMARTLINDRKALYVIAESLTDVYEKTNVVYIDYREYKEKEDEQRINTVLGLAKHYKAELVVIDPVTKFFGSVNKPIEEADVRGGLFKLATKVEFKLPVIGISEVRGPDNFAYPAGGQAVAHSGILLVDFLKIRVKDEKMATLYGKKIGSFIYLIQVDKDRTGYAEQGYQFLVNYYGGEMQLEIVEGYWEE